MTRCDQCGRDCAMEELDECSECGERLCDGCAGDHDDNCGEDTGEWEEGKDDEDDGTC